MKIRNGFVLREIADSIVVVPTGDLIEEFKGMINLNSTGKFIWELLKEDTTCEEIAQKLVEKYCIDENKAKSDAEKFIQTLRDAKIIEE